MATRPRVQFFRAPSGQRVAYASHGEGPPLICTAWWVSHLEDDWESEAYREFFTALGHGRRVIRYDRVGSGLSDRERDAFSLADEVSVLSALVDHLALDRVSLMGIACAGPPSIEYALAQPERVDRLVLFGSYARGDSLANAELRAAVLGLVRASWGMGSRALADLFAPELPAEVVGRLGENQRAAASREMAAQLLQQMFEMDVENQASTLQTPTLVMHRRGDRAVPAEAGRTLAALLPDAELRLLDGAEHVPWLGDSDLAAQLIHEFLGSAAPGPASEPEPPQGPSLQRQGEVWTFRYEGSAVHLGHARGIQDIATLLASPGQSVSAATLVSGVSALPEGGEMLDDEALRAYRARLTELQEAIEAHQERGDVDGAERLHEERDFLLREIDKAVGLGGRRRRLGDEGEKARKAVSARVRASIKKISAQHPALGAHLSEAISTGHDCVYQPQPPVEWRVQGSPDST